MKRKLTVIALTLALIVTMMPIYTGEAFAGVPPGDVLTFYNTRSDYFTIDSSMLNGKCMYGTAYGGFVTGMTAIAETINDIPDNNWNWAVEKNEEGSTEGDYTLVLNNFNITGSAENLGVLDLVANCTIELRGDSNITNTSGSAICVSSANMYFKGPGTLTATGGEVKAGESSCGINLIYGNITISSGTITAKGGNSLHNSYGIFTFLGNIDISGGTVNAHGQQANGKSIGIFAENSNLAISNATVSAISSKSSLDQSYGIYSSTGITISNSHVDAKSGESSEDCNSYGICTTDRTNGITISENSTVNANGGKGGCSSSGIISYGDISISSGCEVTATSDSTTNGDSYGIYTDREINTGGTVYATGGTSTSGSSFGIYSLGLVNIKDKGTVDAKGQSAKDISVGLYIENGALELPYDTCSITATGGAVTATDGISYGIFTQDKIASKGTIHATGGDAKEGYSFGIYSSRPLDISGGAVTSTAGKALANSCGIYTHELIEISNASVTAIGKESNLGYSTGIISFSGDINIKNNSIVNTTGDKANGSGPDSNSHGICAYGSINVSDNSIINAKSGQGYGICSGIYSNTGRISISSGCEVTATGGAVTATDGTSYGIFTQYNIASKGTIHATGGNSSGSSFGLYTETSSIELNGGSGSAKASTGTTSQAFNTKPVFTNITTSTGAWNSPKMTWGEAPTPPTSPSPSGSYSPSPAPTIITDSNSDSIGDTAGGTATFDSVNNKIVITPADGFEVADVTVNGVSKGNITELTDILSSDKVVVTFAKSKTPEQIEAEKQAKIFTGVKTTRIINLNAVKQKNGKVKLTWQKSYGFKVDQYNIYRSDKKNSGFTKVFTSKTKRFITGKNLKVGTNIYFKVVGVRNVGGKLIKTNFSKTIKIKIK